MSSFTIRKAILSDLDYIINIRNQASKRLKVDGVDQWQDVEPSRKTFIKDIQNKEAYVMIDQDKIIGIASLCLSKEEAYQDLVDLNIFAITIHRIAIHDDYLLKGLSNYWFEFFEKQAKNLRRNRIYIDTHPNNVKMLSLLRKYQYQYIGEFKFKHLPSPLRRLFMKTILS